MDVHLDAEYFHHHSRPSYCSNKQFFTLPCCMNVSGNSSAIHSYILEAASFGVISLTSRRRHEETPESISGRLRNLETKISGSVSLPGYDLSGCCTRITLAASLQRSMIAPTGLPNCRPRSITFCHRTIAHSESLKSAFVTMIGKLARTCLMAERATVSTSSTTRLNSGLPNSKRANATL